jgi:hypothetical protein
MIYKMPLPSWINDKPLVKGFRAKPTDLAKIRELYKGSEKRLENNKIDNEYINTTPITPQADINGDQSNTYGDDADSSYYESEY